MERGRQYRVVTQTLTALAGLLAVAGAVTAGAVSGATAGFLLSLGVLVVAGAIYASGNAAVHYDLERETHDQANLRETASLAVTVTLTLMLVALLFVEVLAVLAGLGYFRLFGEAPRIAIRYYGVPVGLLLAAFSAAVALRTHYPGEGEPDRRERITAYLALAAVGAIVVGALSINGGVAQSLGIIETAPNRGPFLLALAFFPLFRALRVLGRYPAPHEALASIGDRLRAKERGIGDLLVTAGAVAAVTAVALGAFLHYGYGRTETALMLCAGGALLMLVAPVGVGFARVVEEIEETREDYEARRRRRRATLVGFTTLHTALAALALGLAVLAPVLGLGPILLAHFPVLFLAIGVAAVAGVVARTRVRAEDEYTTLRKVVGSQLVAATAVLAFVGVFLVMGLARGPIVGADNAVLLVSAAWGVALLYVKNRLLLPSVIERAIERYRERQEKIEAELDPDERVQRSMLAAYLAGIGILFLGIVAIALMFVGKIPEPSTTGTQIGLGALWVVLAMLALGVGVFRQLQKRNIETVETADEDQAVIGERRFRRHEVLRYTALGLSISLAVALLALGGLIMAGVVTNLAGRPIAQKYSTDFFVFGLLLGLGPYGFFHAREQKRIRKMDERLPEFLRDLAESKRAGMTLTEAIITASKGTYGELTPEIRKMAAQLEWGVSFTDALTRFSHRVDTPLVERTVNLIVEASNAGGNVVDVLTAAADDAREIQQILQERRDSMVVYVMIIYVAFLVFLGVIGVLNAQFIPEISEAVGEASKQGAPSIGGLQFSEVDTQAYRTLFFHAAVIQGLGGGLVAGVMRGGKPVEGLKHSFAMIALAYVIFRFFIGA